VPPRFAHLPQTVKPAKIREERGKGRKKDLTRGEKKEKKKKKRKKGGGDSRKSKLLYKFRTPSRRRPQAKRKKKKGKKEICGGGGEKGEGLTVPHFLLYLFKFEAVRQGKRKKGISGERGEGGGGKNGCTFPSLIVHGAKKKRKGVPFFFPGKEEEKTSLREGRGGKAGSLPLSAVLSAKKRKNA